MASSSFIRANRHLGAAIIGALALVAVSSTSHAANERSNGAPKARQAAAHQITTQKLFERQPDSRSQSSGRFVAPVCQGGRCPHLTFSGVSY